MNIVLIVAFILHFDSACSHAVSNGQGGSRFGDQIMGYTQARYISKITNLPFLYRSFLHSECLIIENDAEPLHLNRHKYSREVHIKSETSFSNMLQEIQDPLIQPTLYVIDFFQSSFSEWNHHNDNRLILNIPWIDNEFLDFSKKILKPKIVIPDFTKPGVLNVAVHVRYLSGGDTPDSSWKGFPLRCPQVRYQKEQLKRLYRWNKNRPIYVFLFTDKKDQQGLLNEFKQEFNGYNIEFGIQFLDNPDLSNTVQDFFAMQKFNVLIATMSNFSRMISHFGDFDMVFLPVHYTGEYPNWYVDGVHVVSKKSDWFPYSIDMIYKP